MSEDFILIFLTHKQFVYAPRPFNLSISWLLIFIFSDLAFSPHFAFFSDPYSFLFACLLICSMFVFTWYISTSPHATHPSLLQDKEPRGIIPLENLSIREVEEPRKPVSAASLETSSLDHMSSCFLLCSCAYWMFKCNYFTVAHH